MTADNLIKFPVLANALVRYRLEGDIQVHPIAEEYILSPPEERVAASVKRQGTIEPVTTYEDMLLDGRIRDKANIELGLPRWALRFEDTPQGLEAIGLDKKAMDRAALEYVVAKNMERHHYTQGQLAMMAYRMADMAQGARTDLGEPSAALPKVSQAEAAERFGVSVRSMGNAGRIDREGTPEEIKAAETGMPLEPIVATINAKEKARSLALSFPAPSTQLLLDKNGNPILNQIICGDALERLQTFSDRRANTIVTSPPYYGLRDYGMEGQIGLEETLEEYVHKLVLVFRESRRVLRYDGTLWLIMGDTYAASRDGKSRPDTLRGEDMGTAVANAPHRNPENLRASGLKHKDLMLVPFELAKALRSDGWYLRAENIWSKPDAMPESVTDRPTRAHEQVFLLAKSETYYYDHEAIMEPAVSGYDTKAGGVGRGADDNFRAPRAGKGLFDDGKRTNGNTSGGSQSVVSILTRDGQPFRNKRSVWTIATQPFPDAHFATFPPKLIEPCILAGSAVGGVVLDIFMGAGTTALVARRLGRNFLGIELNSDYVRIAEKRLREEQT